MFKLKACIDKKFAVQYSGLSWLTRIFNLSIPIMTILQAKSLFKVARYDVSYHLVPLFSVDRYGLMA